MEEDKKCKGKVFLANVKTQQVLDAPLGQTLNRKES